MEVTRRNAPDAGLAKPRGAAPKTELIRLRVEPALKARIEAESKRQRMTVSAWITWLAERELDVWQAKVLARVGLKL